MYKLTWPLYLLISLAARAQDSPAPHQSVVVTEDLIVCYSSNKSTPANIPPPEAYLATLRAGARVQSTATFEVNYLDGFPESAKKAFQRAMDIWAALLTSNVTIKINAEWKAMGDGVLATCGPGTYHKNFPGAQREEVYYPSALANKIANTDLNESGADMSISINSGTSWHYDPDATHWLISRTDLTTVVLHEIGHGLGVISVYHVTNGNGEIHGMFGGKPGAYDLFLESGNGTSLLSYTPPSRDIANVLTSTSLYFRSPIVTKDYNGRGKVYAPAEYNGGSSLSHNDEYEYPSGNANSLMTPFSGLLERILDPGPITMGELIDMGWGNPILTHTRVANKNSRASDIEVVCKLVSGDSRYPPSLSTLKLYYKKNTEAAVSVGMTATGTADEYKATIPRPLGTDADLVNYSYYISVDDGNSRTFTWPGKKVNLGGAATEQVYYTFTISAPIRPPIVYHTPLTRVKNTANMEIVAAFKHEYGIQNGFVDWKVNDNAQTRVSFEHVSDSTYKATLPLTGLNLTGTETIRYRITTTGHSTSNNTTAKPSENSYYQVTVAAYKAAQERYANNFDNQNANDFWGDFTISQATNFSNAAIQSPHPYKSAGEKGKTSIDYTYELLTPIKVKEGMGTITFDEVVLVEPGNEGAAFGSPNFNDYVVVEGSTDRGSTWKPVANGWDSGDKSNWRTAWNSQKDGSTAKEGNPNLYHKRSLNLLSNFKANDEVILRFRLFSNEGTAGWGWAIDNLAIQLQDGILHNHLDYVMNSTETVRLQVQALDANAIQSLSFKVKLNEQEEVTHPVDLSNKSQNVYQIDVPYPNGTLKKGDHINYRIDVTNTLNATASLPSTGYYRIEVLDLSEPVISYPDITTDKFFGNFITTTPTTIETAHPYAAGFGTNYQSEFSAILSKPLKLEAKRPDFTFKEKLLPGANDYVQVEGSKDGIAWKSLSDKYTTAATDLRTVSFFKDNEFKEGDVILLRFRLSSDKTGTGWGWEISTLQFPENAVTAIEEKKEFSLFPNPVKKGDITIQVNAADDFSAEVSDIYGRQILFQPYSGGTKEIKLSTDNLSSGLYLLSLREGKKRRTLRFVKL